MSGTSEAHFYLIGSDGARYVPFKKRNGDDGRYGYEILPVGLGNNPSSAEYTEDINVLVQRVVLDGLLVRAKVMGGAQDGQSNSVGLPELRRKKIRGYWLAPGLRHLVAGAKLQSTTGSDESPTPWPSPEQDIAEATSLPERETERQAVVAARRGQGVFRALLDAHWTTCAVTGCATRALLRASHIQPWRDCDNRQRLDPFNGLLLTAHLDAAFDAGLISFADDGRLLVNTARLPIADAEVLGLGSGARLRSISPEHRPYLAKHRALHGFGAEP